jgi:hypothetical protein
VLLRILLVAFIIVCVGVPAFSQQPPSTSAAPIHAQNQTVNNLRNQAPPFSALRGIGLPGASEFPHGMLTREGALSSSFGE